MKKKYVIGIDVGTGSVRAGIFDTYGSMTGMASNPIQMWNPKPDFAEHSSEDIWQACCKSVQEAVSNSGVGFSDIQGVGFDATCSLVVLGENDQTLSVTPGGPAEQNVIVWMDHRAKAETLEINEKRHEVLKYVGGVISPEMQTPKLLWLKRHHPETWKQAGAFFDLADFMVYKATNTDVRSLCTTTCKWTYLSHKGSDKNDSIGRWDDSYFSEIGLEDLANKKYKKIGSKVRPMGEPVGNGLTEKSAEELGLKPGTPVSVSMIDAHAGGSPPALVKLQDGRLALAYIFRSKFGSRVHLKLSEDHGKSWSHEMTLRSNDNATNDVGYPRMVQRTDGKLVIVYYWNHAADENEMPYRYIAATIVDPDRWE